MFFFPRVRLGSCISGLVSCYVVALTLLCMSASMSWAQPASSDAEWNGSDDQKLWGLMTVWSGVKYTFPHFDRMPELDWDAEVRACMPKVRDATDVESYYAVLQELVTKLQDSHTLVLPPWGYLKPGWDFAPIEVRILDGRFYVDRVGERSGLADEGIVPGAEIVAVDGVEVAEYFEQRVLRYHSQGSRHADEATLVVYLLYGPGAEAVELRLRGPDGPDGSDGLDHEASVVRDAMSASPPFMTRMLFNAFASPTIRTSVLEGGIQYVEIPNFENDQIRFDFEQLIDEMDESTVHGMILDLRNNMGGANSISDPMVACLIEDTVSSPTMKFRNYAGAYEAWGREQEWDTAQGQITPRDGKRYLGPLVILTNGVTNSSAEDFVIELQAAGRARTVGQRTAGGAGNALVSVLPGGGMLRVATFTALTPDGVDYVGFGIAPDVEVSVTPGDLENEVDPVLMRAMEIMAGM